MGNNQRIVNGVCRQCGSKEADARADARAVGFRVEFLAGEYSCCQVVQWADEQWIAWQEAALEDGKVVEEAMLPLEISEQDAAVRS